MRREITDETVGTFTTSKALRTALKYFLVVIIGLFIENVGGLGFIK